MYDPCDENTKEHDCWECRVNPDMLQRDRAMGLVQCNGSCMGVTYPIRCKRMVKHTSGKCWQHRSHMEKNIVDDNTVDNNIYPESIVNDLVHYVRVNNIRVIVFDYDLTSSKIHLRGVGSYTVKQGEEKHTIQQQYIYEQSKHLTTPFILAMNILNNEGYNLAIATMSDASRNTTKTLLDGSTQVIYTGEPFIKDVLKNIFPDFYRKIYIVGKYADTKKTTHEQY
jgi:hypothetical protein